MSRPRFFSAVRGLSFLFWALLLALAGSRFWPVPFWWLAGLVQLAPLWVLLIPLAFLFLLSLRWGSRKIVVFHAGALVLLVFFIMDFNVPRNFLKPVPSEGKVMRVMTGNLGGGTHPDLLIEYLRGAQPDIMVFQEVNLTIGSRLRQAFPSPEWSSHFSHDFAVLTRYRISEAEVINRETANDRSAVLGRYVISAPFGRFRVYNVHLETLRKGIEAILARGVGGLGEMREVASRQENEARLAEARIRFGDGTILAGDFNMRESSPVYRMCWSDLNDAFAQTSWGFGYTWHSSWHGVRIDHILYDAGWRALKTVVGPDLGGDHRPLLAGLVPVPDLFRQEKKVSAKAVRISLPPARNIFVFEDFESSLSRFEREGFPGIKTQWVDGRGNVLVLHETGDEGAFSAGMSRPWRIDLFPFLRFSYQIPEGVPFGLRVRTRMNDWIWIAGTPDSWSKDPRSPVFTELINDGQWHEVEINVGGAVTRLLKAMNSLEEWELFVPGGVSPGETVRIDNILIFRKTE